MLAEFESVLEASVVRGAIARLGLVPSGDTDHALVGAVYAFLSESAVGYDRFFFDWYGGLQREARATTGESKEHYSGSRWEGLRCILELYEPALQSLPVHFEAERPCTLLIDEIESVWSAIAGRDDWGPFEETIRAIGAFGSAVASR